MWQPDGSRVWGRMDTRVCTAESLHCSPGTTTTPLIGYTPTQNTSLKSERKGKLPSCPLWALRLWLHGAWHPGAARSMLCKVLNRNLSAKDSVAVQGPRFYYISGWGTKIPQATWWSQKKKETLSTNSVSFRKACRWLSLLKKSRGQWGVDQFGFLLMEGHWLHRF